jgi:hypothetical protein
LAALRTIESSVAPLAKANTRQLPSMWDTANTSDVCATAYRSPSGGIAMSPAVRPLEP